MFMIKFVILKVSLTININKGQAMRIWKTGGHHPKLIKDKLKS